MNAALLVAGGVAVATGVFHIYAGERRIFARMRPDGLPHTHLGDGVITRRMLRAISHLWGVSWFGAAAIFFALSENPLDGDGKVAVRIVATTFALYAAVILLGFGFRHSGWPMLSAVAVAAWGGTM